MTESKRLGKTLRVPSGTLNQSKTIAITPSEIARHKELYLVPMHGGENTSPNGKKLLWEALPDSSHCQKVLSFRLPSAPSIRGQPSSGCQASRASQRNLFPLPEAGPSNPCRQLSLTAQSSLLAFSTTFDIRRTRFLFSSPSWPASPRCALVSARQRTPVPTRGFAQI